VRVTDLRRIGISDLRLPKIRAKGEFRHDRRPYWEVLNETEAALIEECWRRRQTLRSIPTLILWGMKDKAFSVRDLARWKQALPHATVRELQEAGHFPQEEAPDTVEAFIKDFLTSTTHPVPPKGAGSE
jgi:pimeloyl-ACP methyl ester carboxylesterase